MKWKKILALGLVVTMGAALAACGAKPQTSSASGSVPSSAAGSSAAAGDESALLQEIKKRGYILIGSSNDAPFSYQDIETQELKGVDIEILREICSRLGVPDIQMKVIDFSNLLVELNNNSIDMVVDAMYVKDDRLQIAAFSDKWYREGEAVVIPQDSPIQSKEDLKGKTLGAQPGTTFYDAAVAWKDAGKIAEVQSFESQAMLMTAVNMGKIDGAMTDGIVAGYTLSQDSALKLKLLEPYEAEASGEIGSAVRFSDKDFLAEVNEALNSMKEDGTLKEILSGYGLNDDYFVDVEQGSTENVK